MLASTHAKASFLVDCGSECTISSEGRDCECAETTFIGLAAAGCIEQRGDGAARRRRMRTRRAAAAADVWTTHVWTTQLWRRIQQHEYGMCAPLRTQLQLVSAMTRAQPPSPRPRPPPKRRSMAVRLIRTPLRRLTRSRDCLLLQCLAPMLRILVSYHARQ